MHIIHKIKMKHEIFQIRAFTLLESLLVLSITAFVILLFSMNFLTVIHIVKGELFILEFENDYKDTQEDAALLGQDEMMMFKNGSLIIEDKNVSVPAEVKFQDFSICFNEKGENSSLSKIQISLPYETKTIHYQLEMGSGKFKKTIR